MVGLCLSSHETSFAFESGSGKSAIHRMWSSSAGYSPVRSSFFDASAMSFATSNDASLTCSFDDSLSQSSMASCTLNVVSCYRTLNSIFSSHYGFSECRIARVRKTFFSKDTTTNDSMFRPVRVTVIGIAICQHQNLKPTKSR